MNVISYGKIIILNPESDSIVAGWSGLLREIPNEILSGHINDG